MSSVKLGSRVYYKESGPEDTGTIIDIVLDEAPFVVKWDKQNESQWKRSSFPPADIAEALGVKQIEVCVNPADENVDQFTADQLVLIEY